MLTLLQANSAAGAAILKTIGVDLSDLNVLLGLTCSPISVIGVGTGSACSGTTVSCSNGVVVSDLNFLSRDVTQMMHANTFGRTALVSAAFLSRSKFTIVYIGEELVGVVSRHGQTDVC